MENAWNVMINKIQERHTIPEFKEFLMELWVHMDIKYFQKLADSMLKRLWCQQLKGHVMKYR